MSPRDPWPPRDATWCDECSKWGYPTRQIAMRELMAVRVTRPAQMRKERGILEGECGYWHLTNNSQSILENNAPEVRDAIIESRRKLKAYKEKQEREAAS